MSFYDIKFKGGIIPRLLSSLRQPGCFSKCDKLIWKDSAPTKERYRIALLSLPLSLGSGYRYQLPHTFQVLVPVSGTSKSNLQAITSKRVGGLRLLDPLLFPRRDHPLVHGFLHGHLCNTFHSPQSLISLLFSRTRPNATPGISLITASLICRMMDIVPRRQFIYTPVPLECLILPLWAVVIPSATFRLSPILRDALVSDLYDYHPLGHYLTPLPRQEIPVPIRTVNSGLRRAFHLPSSPTSNDHVLLKTFLGPRPLNHPAKHSLSSHRPEDPYTTLPFSLPRLASKLPPLF
ncbi:hypothetical protein BD560DRAFT_431042 [Blakeslea trispora]|nr:hypothetical protein BD560DRAFT_431042 [Blakeslea trispora]